MKGSNINLHREEIRYLDSRLRFLRVLFLLTVHMYSIFEDSGAQNNERVPCMHLSMNAPPPEQKKNNWFSCS